MMTHDFQGCLFDCYTRAEFAAAGLKRTHRAVSNAFTPSEGLLLERWLRFFPKAVLVTNGRRLPRITVYTPRRRVSEVRNRTRRCGHGMRSMEGIEGPRENWRSYPDVKAACSKWLRELGSDQF